MNTPQINTTKNIHPMCYAYTTPDVSSNDGWIKIGYTETQTVEDRIKQQTHTARVRAQEEWRGNAFFDDGSGKSFTDHDFHAYLRKNEIERAPGTEWFKTTPVASLCLFNKFRMYGSSKIESSSVDTYVLRDEQSEAVKMATEHYTNDENGEVLWNCKPRFGKTLSTYDFVKSVNAKNVLIVTNRPAIANSWYDDYNKFLGTISGYYFVSTTESIKDKKLVRDYKTYLQDKNKKFDAKLIYFLSLQDLKGSIHFGGKYNKLPEIKDIKWDILVIDEAHEGVDTSKTDIAFDHIDRKFTLHLSGTPFKALANDKFKEECIYNWTYADEQRKKRDWSEEDFNPYESLPQLNMYTYQMSEIIQDKIKEGIEINGEKEEYTFDLNLFFETDGKGTFKHPEAVDKFLDSLTKNEKYPFSTPELRNELKHTFWILNRVDSAKALAKKLKAHPVFENYEIVLAAGDGKLDDDEEAEKSLNKVRNAIKAYDKTITLSVGQLTTGVTIPEWSAVLMLSNMKSPALYMQAAFRAQNPWKYIVDGKYYRKENAYVFDFDPARTLTIFEEFANDLSSETSDGRGDMSTRKENVRELLNFFPVIGEDEDGRMIFLDAEKVLSIPRKIHAKEVVQMGFMSNFLFQNISNVFRANAIIDIIKKLEPVKEPKKKMDLDETTAKDLDIDNSGNVVVPDKFVENKAKSIFGNAIYGDSNQDDLFDDVIDDEKTNHSKDPYKSLKENLKEKTIDPLIDSASKEYGKDLKPYYKTKLRNKLYEQSDASVNKIIGDYDIRGKEAKAEYDNMIKDAHSEEDIDAAERFLTAKEEHAKKEFKDSIIGLRDEVAKKAAEEIIRSIETQKREDAKAEKEAEIKDRLKGFSRTIPAFLMAYGDENTTLKSFDTIVSDRVFKEVTGISLDEFRYLRDGGKYIDEETGEEKVFSGNLFNPVTFDDAVKEFIRLKKELANYFEDSQEKDIFDYIPPQKTNQIFTPKKIVRQMVDLLEEENPGCFDNPDRTFIDLYMKSGLYIAEIIKRLFRSERMKSLYPSKDDRLRHIFVKQVFGLAPTEIIYNIAKNYILGFSDEIKIEKHNLRQADSLRLIEDGRLEDYLDKEFPR